MTLTRYDCQIAHTRRTPVLHRFSYRSPMWLIDVDNPPLLPGPLRAVARFEAADHWVAGTPSLRQGLDAYLADHGHPAPARADLLTGPRSFGHVFNPLSIWWCYDTAGRQTHVIAEVHNTYGGRHAYLLSLDDAHRDAISKQFYVSPFFAAEGRYRMRISPPGERLTVAIALELGSAVPFTATMHGPGRSVSRWGLLARPLAQLRVVALIKWQGIKLWRRGVAVQPRSGSPEIAAAVAGNLARHDAAPARTHSKTETN